MRRRDVRVYLFDAVSAADAVMAFTAGRTLEEYLQDLMLRSAVERQLEIVGEAMGRALRAEPTLELVLPEGRRVVDFRNQVVHGYDTVDDTVVWELAVRRIPALADEVRKLVERLG